MLNSTIDLAKIALWPYCIGFMVSLLFYSHYHVFGMQLLSPHYIVIGIYVIILYIVLPWALLSIGSKVPAKKVSIIVAGVLLLVDVAIVLFISYPHIRASWVLALAFLSLLTIQLGAFLTDNHNFDISKPWPIGKTAALVLASSAHFTAFFFGAVPYQFGGGLPVEVVVFLEPASSSLLESRFIDRGIQTSTTPSYKMSLFLETESDFFFLRPDFATISINGKLPRREQINDNIVRLRKAIVDRMDYGVSKWINLSLR